MGNGKLNLLLGQLSRLHFRRSYTEFSKLGISQGQPRILRYLKSHEGCIQRELCDNCHLKPATISNVLEKMEKKDLIERRYEPGSRRNIQVFLTEKGHKAAAEVERVYSLLEDEFLSGFSPEEISKAAGFLERILQNLIRADEEAKKALQPETGRV
jgi:DNA-binding MarR family transcriptional regulator